VKAYVLLLRTFLYKSSRRDDLMVAGFLVWRRGFNLHQLVNLIRASVPSGLIK